MNCLNILRQLESKMPKIMGQQEELCVKKSFVKRCKSDANYIVDRGLCHADCNWIVKALSIVVCYASTKFHYCNCVWLMVLSREMSLPFFKGPKNQSYQSPKVLNQSPKNQSSSQCDLMSTTWKKTIIYSIGLHTDYIQ